MEKMHKNKILILMSDYPPCKIYLLECVWTLLASAEMNQKLVEDIPSSPLPPETREYVDFVPNNNKTMNKNVVYLLSDISWIFLLCAVFSLYYLWALRLADAVNTICLYLF